MNASRAMAGLWIHWSERGVGMADLTGMWPNIKAKTLLLNGDRDPLGTRFAEPASKIIPNSKRVVIESCGRFPQQEQPEACSKAIQEFLSG
jgi:pimeloyl-ACP methyl ester carboxylesterase